MAEIVFKIDGLGGVGDMLGHLKHGIASFPERTNPLLKWRADYGARTLSAAEEAPTVGSDGSFRGNAWPRLKPMYTRKRDGDTVYVWGGNTRLRAGVVTRAGSAGIRHLKYMTKAQRAGFVGNGLRNVAKGQRFTGGTVLGKLRSDGSRYRQGDKQMYHRGDLMRDWAVSAPIVQDQGRSVTVTTSKPYAGRLHDLRPFAWGSEIERVESDSALQHVSIYIDNLLREAGRK